MGEDRGLELLQLAPRVEAEVLDQRRPHAPEGVERFGLPAGAVERQHQLRVHTLAVGMFGGQRLELADHRAVLAERELDVEPLLERGEPQSGEPVGLGRGGAEQRRVGERRAAEQRERLAQVGGRPRQVTVAAGAAGALDERLEALEVELARLERDGVARGERDDRLLGAERAPQLGDVDLQRLVGGGGRLLAPQHVGQALGRDCLVAVGEQERRQQRPLLGGR